MGLLCFLKGNGKMKELIYIYIYMYIYIYNIHIKFYFIYIYVYIYMGIVSNYRFASLEDWAPFL